MATRADCITYAIVIFGLTMSAFALGVSVATNEWQKICTMQNDLSVMDFSYMEFQRHELSNCIERRDRCGSELARISGRPIDPNTTWYKTSCMKLGPSSYRILGTYWDVRCSGVSDVD